MESLQRSAAKIQRKATAISMQDKPSGEAGKEDHTLHEMLNHSSSEAATSLRGRLEQLTPMSTTCCIYRVPQKLRKVNEEAYTPTVVSIGPLHYRKSHLVAMEEHKLRYLQNFLSRSGKTIEECVEMISREEKRTRDCYAERIDMSSKEFVEMILVDACFIIEVILGRWSWDGHTGKPDDRIFNKPWLFFDVCRDMTLLENQLPFVLLLTLYSLLPLPQGHGNHYYSFLFLSVKFFRYRSQMPKARSSEELITEIEKKIRSRGKEVEHFVDLLIVCLQPSSPRPSTQSDFPFVIPTATQLREAGVRFELGSEDKPLFHIEYRSDGVLKIPKLVLEGKSESVFRNLIAFEQCHYREDTYIWDYIFLMDQLINTTKDVDTLVNKGIIRHWLGDSVAITDLFNTILINAAAGNGFSFEGIFKGLNEYYNVPWNRSKATLRHQYFSSPWRGASTIAAIILLVLTLIQTIFSGMSVK